MAVKFVYLAISLLSCLAFAGNDPSFFQGDWKSASGVYQKGAELYNCDAVEMVFTGTSSQFNFASGHRHCVSQTNPKNSFDEPFQAEQSSFVNGRLIMNGQDIGTIDGNTMTVTFVFPDTDGIMETYSSTILREGEFVTYHEELTKLGLKNPLISFVTIMKAQP